MSESEKRSVFGNVDQDAMIARIEESTSDEQDSHFLRPLLQAPHQESDRTFDSGIRVLGGDVGPDGPMRESAGIDGPVPVRGELAADPRAARAFVIAGPAGVMRSDDPTQSAPGRR